MRAVIPRDTLDGDNPPAPTALDEDPGGGGGNDPPFSRDPSPVSPPEAVVVVAEDWKLIACIRAASPGETRGDSVEDSDVG